MGTVSFAPVNEAVNLLAEYNPEFLDKFRSSYPSLREELQPGIIAGESDEANDRKYLSAKVLIIGQATKTAINTVEGAQIRIKNRVNRANYLRFFVQVISVVASASVLGSLIAEKELISKILSAVAVAVSIFTLIADRAEKLRNPNKGNIYDAFDKLNSSLNRLISLERELQLLRSFDRPFDEIRDVIAQANGELESINILLPDLP